MAKEKRVGSVSAAAKQSIESALKTTWTEEDRGLTCSEAAAFLRVKPSWLKRARGKGKGAGPAFIRTTSKQISYLREDLVAWRKGRRHESTDEYRPEQAPQTAEAVLESLAAIESGS